MVGYLSEGVKWTGSDKAIALEVLQKVSSCLDEGLPIPADVYEAHLNTKLNVSLEGVPVRWHEGNVQVYLIRRPSRLENPAEPYPGMLHSPGVTMLKNESAMRALDRLIKRELGGIIPRTSFFVTDEEDRDAPRPLYLLRVTALAYSKHAEPKNPRGAWYDFDRIPWEEVVWSHRKFIPEAVAQFEKDVSHKNEQ